MAEIEVHGSAPARRERHQVIRPARSVFETGFGEVWRYRDLLLQLALKDIRLRYRQTFLGVIWLVLGPILGAGAFAFVFGRVAHLASDNVAYFPFAYTGLLIWNLFNASLQRASASLVDNAPLVAKVYVPRLLLPLSAAMASIFDLVVAMLVGVLVLWSSHVQVGWAIALLPVWLALAFVMALGAALAMAALMISYRDVRPVLTIGTSLLLYVSPVAYSSHRITGQLGVIYRLNPLVPLIDATRWSVLGTGYPGTGALALSAAVAGAALVVGLLVFKYLERTFVDVI